jgi:hypothetical protein
LLENNFLPNSSVLFSIATLKLSTVSFNTTGSTFILITNSSIVSPLNALPFFTSSSIVSLKLFLPIIIYNQN